ncbi:MAG: hypothetical protein HY900_31655 [Deltaproteobacteria bacterium]|nr:hypothetical protein [Deltaproteobacteria bacterium]
MKPVIFHCKRCHGIYGCGDCSRHKECASCTTHDCPLLPAPRRHTGRCPACRENALVVALARTALRSSSIADFQRAFRQVFRVSPVPQA